MYTENFLNNKVDFLFHRDKLLNHHTHIYLDREDRQTIKAYDSRLKYETGDIVSVIGEFFEREELINSGQKEKKKIEVISLISGEKRTIETGRIVLKDRFVDSCGMASHYISEKAIKKAYLEFFERQCFIYSFLAKQKAIQIDVNIYDECKYGDIYLKNYVDEIEYYNISLDNNLYVILALGYGKIKKAIGIGTSNSIIEAIQKSQDEMLQNFAAECSKNNFIDIGWKDYIQEDGDIYDKLFFKMSIENFKREFKYLDNGKKRKNNKKEYEFSLYEFIIKMKKIYSMEPFVCFLPSNRSGIKVVKIIDFNWFPHMYPKYYSEEIYNFVENVMKNKLDRKIEFIPFP